MNYSPLEIVYIGGFFSIAGALIGSPVVSLDSEVRFDPVKCVDLTTLRLSLKDFIRIGA